MDTDIDNRFAKGTNPNREKRENRANRALVRMSIRATGIGLATVCLGFTPLQAMAQAGVHGANSPIAPLQERADIVSWQVLAGVKTRVEKNRVLPTYTADVQALNQKTQRVQGFMMPLEPGEKQKHFLLSSVPTNCSFCVAGGPESMVEVRTRVPVKYTLDAVVVEGQFAVLADDPYGMFYRLNDAVSVK